MVQLFSNLRKSLEEALAGFRTIEHFNMDYTYRLRKFNKVKSSIEKYLQRNLQRLPPTSEHSLARALRNYSPEKPVNPALIRITACNQTGCECMVCTSNPSLMTGLSCPDIGSHIHMQRLCLEGTTP